MKIRLAGVGGKVIGEVEANRFSHYIGGIRYWFAYHTPLRVSAGQQVTHIDSGLKVCDCSNYYQACLGDKKAAAKHAIDQLVARVGAERVRSVIDGAKDLPPREKAK